jgi:hypothetical protein
MIITKLIGGLGNQMFQYAAGKALALRYSTSVKVDDSFLKKPAQGIDTQRYFELDIFETPVLIASHNETEKYLKRVNNKFFRELQRRLPFLFKSLRAVESGSTYHVEFEHYPENTYLDGFWQSELYFAKYEKEIRKLFKFRKDIISSNEDMVSRINLAVNPVSLHVRRGDYVKNPEANKFHGLCSIDYYAEAIKLITSQVPNVTLFVFSDDIPWCKENFKFNLPIEFIETNNPHSDLYLMTQCAHNIIANSSFSWWGAWLNNNSNKIVVAPKQWFANKDINTKDVIPEKWIKI